MYTYLPQILEIIPWHGLSGILSICNGRATEVSSSEKQEWYPHIIPEAADGGILFPFARGVPP